MSMQRGLLTASGEPKSVTFMGHEANTQSVSRRPRLCLRPSFEIGLKEPRVQQTPFPSLTMHVQNLLRR